MKTFSEIIKGIQEVKEDCSEIDIATLISEKLRIPRKLVKKEISKGALKIDGGKQENQFCSIAPSSKISFNGIAIASPVFKVKKCTTFDSYVSILITDLNCSSIQDLKNEQLKSFCARIIQYFEIKGYNIDELLNSIHNDEVILLLEAFFKKHLDEDEFELRKSRKKDFVFKLLLAKQNIHEDLNKIHNSIKNDLYNFSKNDLFQDYSRVFNSKFFKLLIEPVFGGEIDFSKYVHAIIDNYKGVYLTKEQGIKINKRFEAFRFYGNILRNPNLRFDEPTKMQVEKLIELFKAKIDKDVEFVDSGNPEIKIVPENRTYNFSDETLIYGYIENIGSGIAKDISIIGDNIELQLLTSYLPPLQKSKVTFKLRLSQQEANHNAIELSFDLTYRNETNDEVKSSINNFSLEKQAHNLPWDALKLNNPYSLEIVDDPEKLFGREDLMKELTTNIELNRRLKSYVIHGQKRIGKSSIIRTLDSIYSSHKDVVYIYKTIGDIRDPFDAAKTYNKLCRFIFNKLSQGIKQRFLNFNLDELESVKVFDFSLPGLIEFVDEISTHLHIKIVIAIDEFDELNSEFFENNELGKSFALNLGKGLNDRNNVSIILVGSETLEAKTKQGMRLNAFDIKKIDTFEKQSEFKSYSKIITEPVKSCLHFSNETLDSLFDITNGNPYYTNVIMDKVFQEAYEKKIAFIDVNFVSPIIDRLVSSILSQKDFQHFWDDGLAEEKVDYEKVLDRRKRILTAFC